MSARRAFVPVVGLLALLATCLLGVDCADATAVVVTVYSELDCQTGSPVTLVSGAQLSDLRTAAPSASSRECVDAPGNTPPEWGRGQVVLVRGTGVKSVFAVMQRDDGKVADSCLDPSQAAHCVVAKRQVSFLQHTTSAMRVDLRRSCLGVVCSDSQTCVRGGCVDVPAPSACPFVNSESCIPTPDASVTPSPEAGVDAGSEAGSDAGSDAGSCPTEFVLVPGDSSLGTSAFCVAKYEMRNVGGVATSQAASLPWSGVSLDSSVVACSTLGAGYDLITNAQWQTLARNIAGTASNWSLGKVGAGYLNIGNADNAIATRCDSTSEYVDLACGSTVPTGNFMRKRTHVLSNGNIVWDLGGNQYEFVKDLSTAGQYGPDVCVPALSNTNPASDTLGLALAAFGLASTSGYSLAITPDPCSGLGGLGGVPSSAEATARRTRPA